MPNPPTYTISDALSIANRGISRVVEDDTSPYIANIALNEVWMAYDWRETMADLPPFWLSPAAQDYGAPFYAVPNDYFGLRFAYLVQLTSNPATRRPLKIVRNLRQEFVKSMPTDIGYSPEKKAFRIYPCPPDNLASSQFLIDGVYKKRAPKVTAKTLQTTLVPWDDQYIQYFIAALRWAAAEASDSPTTSQKKQTMYEGLAEMAAKESLELGDQVIAPSEGLLGDDGTGFSNLYGLIF